MLRRDAPDLSAKALGSMEHVQHLGEFTSDERGESPEVPAPYLEELTHGMTRTIYNPVGGASYTSGVSSHNLTNEVVGDASQGTSHDVTMDVMDNSTRKVIHGPAGGSEPLKFPMPVCGTEIKVQSTIVPQTARSTESGMGNVVVNGSIDPGRSPSTVVARGHVPVQRMAERHVHFSTEATMLTGDHSGSRATVPRWVNHQQQQEQDR